MLEKAGFRVLARQNIRQSLWLRYSINRARRNGHLHWPYACMQSKFASSGISRFQQWLGRADGFLLLAEKTAAALEVSSFFNPEPAVTA